MAILDDDAIQGTSGGTVEGNKAADDYVKVSLDNAELEGTGVQYDPEADYYDRPAPPKAGVYGLRMFVDKDGWKKSKDGNFVIGVDYKIEDCLTWPDKKEEYLGHIVSGSLSTTVPRGKRTSSIATVLAKFGGKVGELQDTLRTAKVMAALLKKEPVIYAWVDWKGWSKKEKDTIHWEMSEFPMDEVTNEHVYQYKRNGEQITANAYVKRIIGKLADAQAMMAETAKKGNATASNKARTVVAEKPKPAATATAKSAPAPAPPKDEGLADFMDLGS